MRSQLAFQVCFSCLDPSKPDLCLLLHVITCVGWLKHFTLFLTLEIVSTIMPREVLAVSRSGTQSS